MTTVKVTDDLHARLVSAAAAEGTTIGGVIGLSLDVLEESRFWAAVEQTMIPDALRASADGFAPTLMDGLDPRESWEDVL